MEDINAGQDIAIIGMSCRFPGANNLEEYWNNIVNGRETITFFSKKELEEEGIEAKLLDKDNYIRANGILEGIDLFDASFFGISKREAELMDPQHRLFLEESYKALDDAGYSNIKHRGHVGVFGGSDVNTYMINNLARNPNEMEAMGGFFHMITNDKDYLPTRVSYLLNLNGPSVNIQTACSTSLVATHMACQSLINGECDIALAGGAGVRPPMKQGYLYLKDMVRSVDGHCKPFDKEASGTGGGNGVGVVVLKLLEDALNDNDNIYAVIKSTVINNDGSNKVGYTAPSVKGQSDAILEAIKVADVDPRTIGFLEAHGTGTKVGDVIEIEALNRAYNSFTDEKGFCALGAVKANIGHTGCAAGVAGLIKTAMVIKNGTIPPLANYSTANPNLQIENTAFFIPEEPIEWSDATRRAAVSAFGIGGTNAHVILQNAPIVDKPKRKTKHEMISLSAKTMESLDDMTERLKNFVEKTEDLSIQDLAYTLHHGRTIYPFRRSIPCRSKDDLLKALQDDQQENWSTNQVSTNHLPVFFLFPGWGGQYSEMFSQLYEENKSFKKYFDECAEIANKFIGFDLRDMILKYTSDEVVPSLSIKPKYTCPLIFAGEYALAKILMDMGIQPDAMIGHSLGDYVAATLAGVFNLEDAIELVYTRGVYIEEMEAGAMVSIMLPAEEVLPMISTDEISFASINTPATCVASGKVEAIELLEEKLEKLNVNYLRLQTSQAFHSWMMNPCVARFEEQVRGKQLNPPNITLISNIHGTIAGADIVTDPLYWAKHISHTVNFQKGIANLLESEEGIFIEVGPGKGLANFLRQNDKKKPSHVIVNMLAHRREKENEMVRFIKGLGDIWGNGVVVEFEKLYENETYYRCSLPSYSFQRKSYWVNRVSEKQGRSIPIHDASSNSYYTEIWKQSFLNDSSKVDENELTLVCSFGKKSSIKPTLLKLKNETSNVLSVGKGDTFNALSENEVELNPESVADYLKLFELFKLDALEQVNVVFECTDVPLSDQELQEKNLFELLVLSQAMGKKFSTKFQLLLVTNTIFSVTGVEDLKPGQALLHGAAKTISLEYQNVMTKFLDVNLDNRNNLGEIIFKELKTNSNDEITAYRGAQRFVQTFEKVNNAVVDKVEPPLKDGGVYLIIGGYGGLGTQISEAIASSVTGAKLVLMGRNKISDKKEWPAIQNDPDHPHFSIVQQLSKVAEHAADLKILNVDVSNRQHLKESLAKITKEWGDINGVVHAAGVLDDYGIIENRDKKNLHKILTPKYAGMLSLDELINYDKLDFLILFSSISTIFYKTKIGQVGDMATNEFVDAFGRYHHSQGKRKTKVINWNDWKDAGIGLKARQQVAKMLGVGEGHAIFQDSISAEEGKNTFIDALSLHGARMISSKQDVPNEHANYYSFSWTDLIKQIKASKNSAGKRGVQELNSKYEAPSTIMEKKIAEVWSNCLRIEKVGINDNFFELGGHSLLAIQLMNSINSIEEVECEISLEVIFQNPTIKGIADFIENVKWLNVAEESTVGEDEDVGSI